MNSNLRRPLSTAGLSLAAVGLLAAGPGAAGASAATITSAKAVVTLGKAEKQGGKVCRQVNFRITAKVSGSTKMAYVAHQDVGYVPMMKRSGGVWRTDPIGVGAGVCGKKGEKGRVAVGWKVYLGEPGKTTGSRTIVPGSYRL